MEGTGTGKRNVSKCKMGKEGMACWCFGHWIGRRQELDYMFQALPFGHS